MISGQRVTLWNPGRARSRTGAMISFMSPDPTLSPGPLDDAQLAALVARSLVDPHAFTGVVASVAPRAHRWMRVAHGPDGADDIVAEALLEAFRVRSSFDAGRGTVRSWFLGIVARVAHRHRRRSAVWMRTCERQARGATQAQRPAGDIGAVQDGWLAPELAESLRRLPHSQREVLLLFALADLGYTEIAAVLGIADGTVRSRLNRARTTLATELAPIAPEGLR